MSYCKHSNIMLRNEEARLTIIKQFLVFPFCRRDARQTMFHSLQQYKRDNHGKTKSARIQKRNVFSTDKNEM